MTSTTAAARKPDYSTYPTLDRAQATAAAEQLLALKGDGARVDATTLRTIEAFYFREARLLDEERYLEWYDTLADDLFYWLPLRENRYRRDKRPPLDPASMAMFDERKADIAVRIGRIESNLVWTEDPPTRHVYVVTNVEAFETSTPGEYEVHSAFVQHRNRSEHDEATLIGRRRDIVRAVEGDFLLTKNLSAFF
jgi:ethylbenzene dioxygenase subunit beta